MNMLTDRIAAERSHLTKLTRRFTKDREESSDLVQETLLKALLYKDSFREDTNLKGWLFTIMRNTFINSYRKNKRIKSMSDGPDESPFLQVTDNHTFNCPENAFEYQDLCNHISSLKEELLLPFKMHTSGYKYHEIADHLGLPIGTVKNRIFQARKGIQERMTGYNFVGRTSS